MLPTARHLYNISSKGAVLPAGAMTRRWARELVTHLGIMQQVQYNEDLMNNFNETTILLREGLNQN